MTERSGTFFVKGEKIVLKRDGTWFADGIEITHDQTRDLFFRIIQWDPKEEKYFLHVGYETIYIEVEDTPFFVTSLRRLDGSAPEATLSNFEIVPMRAPAVRYENGNLYLALPGGQRAKFLSAPYYDLLSDLEEDSAHYFVTIAGERANLAPKAAGSPAAHPGAPKRR